jgi:hypothetical protein
MLAMPFVQYGVELLANNVLQELIISMEYVLQLIPFAILGAIKMEIV